MTTKDILQIILIPILTLILTKSWDLISTRRAKNFEKDKEVFTLIKDCFEGEVDLVNFFRAKAGHKWVPLKYLESVWALQEILYRPGVIFTIKKLEKLRINLRGKINKYESFFSEQYDCERNENCYKLKYSDEEKLGENTEAIEKFRQLYNEVVALTSEISAIYKQLAEVVRKEL